MVSTGVSRAFGSGLRRCPFSRTDGDDLPRLINELVPGSATERDDFLVGFEDAVRQPVVAHEPPDILHEVQRGRPGR